MTIHIPYWLITIAPPLLLFAAPFIYMAFREHHGDYDLGSDVMFVAFTSWGVAIGLVVGVVFAWLTT